MSYLPESEGWSNPHEMATPLPGVVYISGSVESWKYLLHHDEHVEGGSAERQGQGQQVKSIDTMSPANTSEDIVLISSQAR